MVSIQTTKQEIIKCNRSTKKTISRQRRRLKLKIWRLARQFDESF